MHLVGFTTEMYYDARPYEHQKRSVVCSIRHSFAKYEHFFYRHYSVSWTFVSSTVALCPRRLQILRSAVMNLTSSHTLQNQEFVSSPMTWPPLEIQPALILSTVLLLGSIDHTKPHQCAKVVTPSCAGKKEGGYHYWSNLFFSVKI